MTTSTSPDRAGHLRGPVGLTAERCIRRLQKGYRGDRPAAVSTLARLRRGAGRPAHAVPDLWGLTGTDELAEAMAELPEDSRDHIDHVRAEEALHLVLTLWALHQQSHRDADMHVAGRGLGRAVRMLMNPRGAAAESGKGDSEPDEPVRRRFVRAGTATTLEVLAVRLRDIVLLLRREDIALDYGLLADQLYRWQLPVARADVRRSWGRDFHLAGVVRDRSDEPGGE
ncbi:type I-E CRISPR-associated protein Cse2/CasB [Actinacidiphila sp. ITFR-21]|uniref:type I-E CRISPR-associated protein Cse2/CasB n=1 Tax=Actinacidiphila sp. ITFR-21 TaxID=3075199 RepID=UPI002889D5F7|nr:type I-E CRISPR-associated protein Cse2/CasB [Streptomyces sp. ITFR-21]WNI16532.1 type I-E CRISPR-associated protein Cse2/CasB [Streptomyces sp. ITFR-21]